MADADQAADREAILALYGDEDRELVELIIRSKDRTANRVGEIIAFAQAAGFQRIGIAYCAGLADEAGRLKEMLEPHFEVTVADCKVFGLENGDFVEGASGAAKHSKAPATTLGVKDRVLGNDPLAALRDKG